MSTDLSLEQDTIQFTQSVKKIRQAKVIDPNAGIKKGIWLYFFLLIFEGALRKWILPGLSTPLLIIRDPVAMYVVFAAMNRGLIRNNIYLFGMVTIGILGTFTALTVGHGNILVAIYGARMFLFHFPMMFIMGRVFTREDVVKVGKITLLIAIPMAVLIALQFYSPQSAWVNRGLGDDAGGAGFSGALGYFRPPGTFSFTTGNTLFFGFAGVYVFYFLFNPKTINRILLVGASLAVMISIPLSISRSLSFQIVLSLIFAFAAVLRKPKNLGKALVGAGLIAVLFWGLSNYSLFQTATNVLTSRFANAEGAEGGLEGTFGDRVFGGMLYSLSSSVNQPFFGYGLGMGTKVGSQLLSGNKRRWLIAEAEWGRVIGELGALMGLSVIFLRVSLTFKLAFASYLKMARGDMLPWMLLSFGFVFVAQGNWSQPTSLGFSTLIGGLLLAAVNNRTASKTAISRDKMPVQRELQGQTVNN